MMLLLEEVEVFGEVKRDDGACMAMVYGGFSLGP